MIRASHAAGATCVKLQKRHVSSLYTAEQLEAEYTSPFGSTYGDYRNGLELDASDFAFVDHLCHQIGIRWFTSVLDSASFDFMRQFAPKVLKLPSTVSDHTEFLEYVASHFHETIVISTGMTTASYEHYVLRLFSRCKRLVLLHCNSGYPTPPEDCNVAVVRHYRDLARANPKIVPGYSSHDHDALASILAVGAGARVLEKHVNLEPTEWGHRDPVALDLTSDAFADYVAAIRRAEVVLGSEAKRITRSEHHKYVVNDHERS